MIKTLTAALALTALASLASAAERTTMTDAQLDTVVAGWFTNCSDGLCGNNGWGNGADPINPGSDEGLTAPSKTCNCSLPADGKVNTNPTTSDGR